MNLITEKVIRGDRWSHEIEVPNLATGWDWATVTLSCQVRAKRDPSSPVLFMLTPRLTVQDGGKALILLDAPGSFTATAPSQVCLDLKAFRASPLFGPYTLAQIELFIQPTT